MAQQAQQEPHSHGMPAIVSILPQLLTDAALDAAFLELLRSPRLSNHGPHATALEAEIGHRLGTPCAAVSSGASALEVSLLAVRQGIGRDVVAKAVLPACTYVATLNAVERVGLVPVFADIDPATWTLSPQALADVLQRHPDVAVVLPVNVYGVPPQLAELTALAHRRGAAVVYDNAHGMGSLQDGRPQPADVDITTWSLHATKVLPAAEGGLITTNDATLLQRVRQLRNHGVGADPFDIAALGMNAKMSEPHALLARHGLAHLDQRLATRRSHWQHLRATMERLGGGRLRLQEIPANVEVNGQNLVAMVVDDAGRPSPELALRWIAALATMGVEARRYFWPPLHQLRRFSDTSQAAPLPTTDAVMPALVCLPVHTVMPPDVLARLDEALAVTLRDLN